MKYRKKPVEVEAMQFTPDTVHEVLAFVESNGAYSEFEEYPGRIPGHFKIYTAEGIMRAQEGDWIIKGIKGEFYPCKPDIFEATYELVEPWEE